MKETRENERMSEAENVSESEKRASYGEEEARARREAERRRERRLSRKLKLKREKERKAGRLPRVLCACFALALCTWTPGVDQGDKKRVGFSPSFSNPCF